MVLLTLVTFSTLFISCSAQQLIKLSSFKGLSVHNEINVEAPYDMYVSAQSDYWGLLGEIYLVTEDGSQVLKYLTQDRNYAMDPFVVKESAYLTTTLSDDDMKTLNGVIFISSKKQREDGCLKVYNIGCKTYIGMDYGVCIHLFLNTSFKKYVINGWSQDPTSKAYLYAGIPQDSPEPENTQIFSNPVHTNEGDWYFRYVNDLSLYMTAFYVKPNKDVYFTIDQDNYPYDIVNGSSTNYVTSTGFYMKPLGSKDGTTFVDLSRFTNQPGFSGANVVGNLPAGGSVTVGFYDRDTKYEHTVTPNTSITPWTIPYVERTFQVSSTNGTDGEYYVQYYVYQEPEVTPPPTPTTVPVVIQTTTQSMIKTTSKSAIRTTSKSRIQTTSKSRIQTTPTSTIQTTTKSAGVIRLVLSMATLIMFWL